MDMPRMKGHLKLSLQSFLSNICVCLEHPRQKISTTDSSGYSREYQVKQLYLYIITRI